MKNLLISLSLATLSLLCATRTMGQDEIKIAGFKGMVGGKEFTIHFKGLNNILISAEISSSTSQKPPVLRIEKRTKTGFIMADAYNSGSRDRLVIEVEPERIILKDKSGKQVAVASWFYEGPVNGRGMHCEGCLDEADSYRMLRRAMAYEE